MTAIQTLIEQLEVLRKECEIQAKYFNKKDMPSSSISSSAMAYSYGIAIEKAKEFLETEKQQMIDFHIEVMKKGLIDEGETKWNDKYLPKIKETAEQYYNQLINKEQ